MKKGLVILFLLPLLTNAQKPREVILENDPVDWTDKAKIVVLIVIPIILSIFGLIYVYNRKRKREGQNPQ